MKNYFNLRKKSKLLLLTLLAVFVGGVSPTWADNADFENSLPTGWETVGTMNYYERAKTGSYSIGNANNSGLETNRGNYIKTTKLKGDIKLWVRSYKSNTTGYVSLYKLSEDGTTVGDLLTYFSSSSTTFAEKTYTLTEATRLAIVINYAHLDNMTYSEAITGPALVVKDGTTAIATNYSYDFGLADNGGLTHTFTLTNPGTAAVEGLSVSETGNFGATLSANTIAADGSVDLTVTMPSTTSSSEITISSMTTGINDFVINVSGTVKEEGKFEEDFSGNALPDGWTKTDYSSTYKWSFTSGYAQYSGYNASTAGTLTLPQMSFTAGEKFFFKAMNYYSSYSSATAVTIQTSTNGVDYNDLVAYTSADLKYNEYTTFAVTIPSADVKYIRFANCIYVRIDDIYGGTESAAPAIALSQTSYDFGLIDSNATSEAITITNTGKSALTGLNITSNNANFTVNCEATEIAANGGTATFTVTMAPNASGAQTATITIKSDNADDLTFTATGAVAKEGMPTETFDDGKPANWTNSSSPSWSFSDGNAVAPSGSWGTYATLTTPLLAVAADDFLAIKVKANNSSYGHLKVFTSTDGTTFGSTALKEVSYTELSTEDYTTIIVTGLTTSVKAVRFEGYQVTIDEISGLTYAPVLSVTQGTGAVTSPAVYAFGEMGANQTVTYNFTNAGAGTINITNVVSDNEVFTTNWTETVVANNYDLTITANYDAEKAGEQNGTVTVTTTEGDFIINLTSTFLKADAPTLDVNNTLSFGKLTANDTQTVTVTNSGTGSMTVDIVSDNALFTVSPAQLTEIGAGASKTFDVTFHFDEVAGNYGNKSANITVTPTYDTNAAIVITATANAKDPDTWSEDFSGNALPSGWEADASYWTFADGVAKSKYNNWNRNNYLFTPTLVVSDASETLTFSYTTTAGSVSIPVYYSKDGSDYTAYSGTPTSLSNGVSGTFTITGLEAGNYKFRFGNDDYNLDNFEGFKLNNDDPKFGYYTDAECKVAAAASETKEFGFVTEAPKAQVYYLKNDNTGTLTLTLGDVPTGFTAVLGKLTLVAGESTTLTINMPVESKGYHSGNIVVTAKNSSDAVLGTFTVAVSGVAVDENKLNLDFATADIPASWTNSYFTKNASGYIESGYTSGTLQTSMLTAEAGETIIIIAKQGYSSTGYTTAVNYRKVGEEEWSTLIAAQNLYNSANWQVITATFAEAGDYELQFVGQYVHIKHIYGLTEPQIPFMAVYDGESAAAAAFSFDNVPNDADAIHNFTIKNEGNGTLAGVTATLSGDQASHYTVEISGLTDGNIAAKSEATLTVKQLKDNLGTHAATLTISSTSEGIDDIVIELSGTTRDASKMYVDFANGVPATWTTTGTWTTTSGYAQAPYSGNATLTSPALTIAAGENLTVDLSKQYNNNNAVLTFRYTTDGGITWSEQDLSSDLTHGSFTTKTLSLGNEEPVTAFIQFVGTYYARIDNIYGGTPTTAPLFALTTAETLTDDKYDFGQALQDAPADKVFTITNNGNGNLVSSIDATGDVTATLATTDGELSNENKTVTLEPGETATITVSLNFDAAASGAKTGSVTIDSNDPVADVVLNFTANVLDATAVNIDFANNDKPVGFYSNGWTYTSGYAANTSDTEAELITSKLTVAGTDDVLSYQVRTYNKSWYDGSLTVQYSTDRKNWTNVATQPSDLNDNYQTFTVSGLEAGDYYLRFAGARVYIDNITGWHFATPAPEHDLFFVNIDTPDGTYVPGSEYTATVKVVNLREESETVAAELYIKNEKADELTEQVIALNETKEFTLTGVVPEEGKHLAYVKVYNDDITIQTDPVTFTSAHNRTLEITEFTRTSDATATADGENKFTATFDVKVKNTGTADLTDEQVRVTITDAEGNPYQSANATETLAVDGETTISVTVTTSALEGGVFVFKAQEEVSGTVFATTQTVTVTAAAPKFALYQGEKDVNDGDNVEFGLTKDWKTLTFKVANEGSKVMEVIPATPAGFDFWEKTSAQATETDSEWSLYFYKESVIDGDQGTFKTTNDENIFILNNLALAQSEGVGFSVHNSDWSTQYGWKSSGVNATATAVELAEATSATGWLQLPDGNYDVIWNTEDHTITFKKAGAFLVAAGESADIDVTLRAKQGKVSGNLTFTYAVDATTNKTFTLALSGRSVSADTWVEEFTTEIPATWTNNGWEWNSDRKAAYSTYSAGKTLMTPRLAAEDGEELNFDVIFPYSGYQMKVQYSTDRTTWYDVATYTSTADNQTFEGSFTAPAKGNYYLKFGDANSKYVYVDNFVGFKLNIPEHDTEIATYSVPETGKQLNVYTATVTLKENAGKAEEVTAKLIVNSEEKATKAETLTANGQTVITLTWTPDAVISEAVKAYVTVTGTGIDLQTDEIDLTIAEVYTLDENSSAATVETVSDETIVLKRKFVEGWNTVCLPFAITDVEAFFGAGAVAYNYTGYTDGALNFTKVTELEASYPYIVYVKTAITTDMTLNNITIESSNNQGWYRTYNNAKFQGTYAPIAAPGMQGKYGVTNEAKIAKGSDKASMKGFRAYFELPNGASARLAFTDEDGTTTIINAIELDKQDGEVYNLNGQRVEGMKKGLYIINGKKVVRK